MYVTVITAEGYEKLAVEVASDSKEWLSASIKSTAAGNEIVSVTAKANTSFKRTGIITLRAGNADKLTKDNSDGGCQQVVNQGQGRRKQVNRKAFCRNQRHGQAHGQDF